MSALAVAVDAAHPLFKAVRIPRNVVVEQNVAALQVDAFAGGLGRDEHLDRPVAELLLSVEPGTGLLPRARLHPTVNEADSEAPGFEPCDQIVEGVFEFGEQQ